jgi:hypothetical protein
LIADEGDGASNAEMSLLGGAAFVIAAAQLDVSSTLLNSMTLSHPKNIVGGLNSLASMVWVLTLEDPLNDFPITIRSKFGE